MAEIIRGSTTKPVAAGCLANILSQDSYDGYLYIGYPIIGTSEGPHAIDAIYVSSSYGVVVFSLIEGPDPGEFTSTQDDNYNKIEAKLRMHKELVSGRKLSVDITPITFAPQVSEPSSLSNDQYILSNEVTIENDLSNIQSDFSHIYSRLLSVLQSVSNIRGGRSKRVVSNPASRGAKLKLLEESIANLDSRQGRAVIETVRGVQRIRGLAGSGKTIVLALKAAYLHAQHPEWKIAVTFNTRSLKDQFRKLIRGFVIEQTGGEPDWENLKIIHAWGSAGGVQSEGLYYLFCQEHGKDYRDFSSAKSVFGQSNALAGACEEALSEFRPKQLFDCILVDEAQDFPVEFLRLCYWMLGEERQLVYAYDELQSLSGNSLPSPDVIFGVNEDGRPRVTFDSNLPGMAKQDIILEKCYRNSRPALVTAHALGFGIYRTPPGKSSTGLVQMFENHHLWEEVGYQVSEGSLTDGSRVKLVRSESSSPAFLEEHSPYSDLVSFKCFQDYDEQVEWIAEQIRKNIQEDELKYDDIIVINPDPLTTRKVVAPIRAKLFKMGINSHLAGVDTSPDVFFKTDFDSIAFTGIYRAKGNEAAMVYVINAQDCYSDYFNVSTMRNRLFTAITRSKAWVRVVGVGANMELLAQEARYVADNNYSLDFIYPDEEERKNLRIVNRDLTGEEINKIKKRKQELEDLTMSMEAGMLMVEDLDPALVARLKSLLDSK